MDSGNYLQKQFGDKGRDRMSVSCDRSIDLDYSGDNNPVDVHPDAVQSLPSPAAKPAEGVRRHNKKSRKSRRNRRRSSTTSCSTCSSSDDSMASSTDISSSSTNQSSSSGDTSSSERNKSDGEKSKRRTRRKKTARSGGSGKRRRHHKRRHRHRSSEDKGGRRRRNDDRKHRRRKAHKKSKKTRCKQNSGTQPSTQQHGFLHQIPLEQLYQQGGPGALQNLLAAASLSQQHGNPFQTQAAGAPRFAHSATLMTAAHQAALLGNATPFPSQSGSVYGPQIHILQDVPSPSLPGHPTQGSRPPTADGPAPKAIRHASSAETDESPQRESRTGRYNKSQSPAYRRSPVKSPSVASKGSPTSRRRLSMNRASRNYRRRHSRSESFADGRDVHLRSTHYRSRSDSHRASLVRRSPAQKASRKTRRSPSQRSLSSCTNSRNRFSPEARGTYRTRRSRSTSSQWNRSSRRNRNAYPGLPTPPKSFSYGSNPASRHLPTKDLVESDFLPSSTPRKYLSARNANADEVWRSKVRKIYQSSWTDVKGQLVDTHCHLDFLFIKISFYGCIDDYFTAFSEAFFPNFDCLITVFCNPISLLPHQFKIWSRILDNPKVYAACGIHPHASHYYTDEVKRNLIDALRHPKVKAVGECGIDRSHKNQIHVDVQARALTSQLKLAVQFNKPVILHARDAYADTLSVVRKVLPSNHNVHLHCYTDSWEMAVEWMNHFPNTMFGFTPLLTFSNHSGVIQTIERLPMDRILLETDSPYFVPRELYQDTNLCHPGFVYCVAERIAKIKGISLDDVVTQTEQNAKQFYDI